MPIYTSCFKQRNKRMIDAKNQVRAKYPKLIEGSSGWFRALNNVLKRGV